MSLGSSIQHPLTVKDAIIFTGQYFTSEMLSLYLPISGCSAP